MNRTHRLPLGFGLLLGVAALGLPSRAQTAPADTFQVAGAVVTPRTWSVAQIKGQMAGQVHALSYTVKGQHHTAQVVPLWSLLQAAGPRVNPQIKHHLLQFFVAVRGQDGYTADFTLGELSPEFGNRAVWVALDEDGKPLTGNGGPVELLVPGDKKPARWVHAVRAIILTDGARLPVPAGT